MSAIRPTRLSAARPLRSAAVRLFSGNETNVRSLAALRCHSTDDLQQTNGDCAGDAPCPVLARTLPPTNVPGVGEGGAVRVQLSRGPRYVPSATLAQGSRSSCARHRQTNGDCAGDAPCPVLARTLPPTNVPGVGEGGAVRVRLSRGTRYVPSAALAQGSRSSCLRPVWVPGAGFARPPFSGRCVWHGARCDPSTCSTVERMVL